MKNPQRISKKAMEKIHPYIPEAYTKLEQGRISRREFMRMSTLLGISAGVATIAAACGSGEAEPGAGSESATGGESAPGTPKRGGTFTKAMLLQLLDHPARLSWLEGANIVRQTHDYLTETDSLNITRPQMLDRWEANDDTTEWDLYLKQGIKFNNGDEFTAEDVMFTFNQWHDDAVGSSMLGLIGYWGGMQNVEMVDDYHIKIHLPSPNFGLPEHLYHYPGVMLHRNFEGDYIKQPIGTGPYLLEEYAEGERARFTRRTDYWKMGADGDPLPYIDEIIYLSIDKDAAVGALQSGQIDTFHQPRSADWQALKDAEDIKVLSVGTAQVDLIRVRVDLDPWTDQRVVQALKMCQDREKMMQLSYFGEGDLGHDAHIAPVHPAYAPRDIPAYDPEGAKALLAEAGYPDGLDVTLVTKNDNTEDAVAIAFKEMAAPGGFNVTLDITDPAGYWDRWADVDLGVTAWTHRPLATMVLPLAYIADADGNPVPWNETRWVDPEFVEVLTEAEGTLDVEARRELVGKLEDIFMERGPVGISYFKRVWNIMSNRVQNLPAHPTAYDFTAEAWLDDEA